jgi:hypothetical protein
MRAPGIWRALNEALRQFGIGRIGHDAVTPIVQFAP